MIDPANKKFVEIVEHTDAAALAAGELAALYREATQDGINVYREMRIKRCVRIIETGLAYVHAETKM